MTDDLNRLRAVTLTDEDYESLHGCESWDELEAAVESIAAARTTALIDRVERAERERDLLQTEVNTWIENDQISFARATRLDDEITALRAAVAGLADEWEALPEPPDEDYDGTLEGNIAYGEWSALRSGARSLRALLTEGADDGQ